MSNGDVIATTGYERQIERVHDVGGAHVLISTEK